MSKYNAKKVTIFYGEIVEMSNLPPHLAEKATLIFDSKKEAEYYITLMERLGSGEKFHLKTQPRYLLQSEFRKNGFKWLKIEYVADFELTYPDGRVEVIDIKGLETEAFKLKRKLFEFKYPNLTLTCLKWVKKFGGWITTEQYKVMKREENKTKKIVEKKANKPVRKPAAARRRRSS